MREYKVTAREESIDCHGLNFLCIYGKHVNGGFVAITNWGVSAELSAHRNDLAYNKSKILKALEQSSETYRLPTDNDAREAVARDLAMMIGERIEKFKTIILDTETTRLSPKIDEEDMEI